MTGSYNDSLESSPVQDTYTRRTLSTQTSFLGSNPRSVPLRVSPVAQTVKNLPAVQETWGGGRSSGEGNGHPLQYSCLENPHGQWSLAGCSPGDHEESDTTEHSRCIHPMKAHQPRPPRTHLEKNKVRHASLLQQGRARTLGKRGAPPKGL